ELEMCATHVAVDAGYPQVFGDVNLRLLQPAQEALPIIERDVGILHARKPLSSFLADQLALPVLATIRVAGSCVAHGYRRRRVQRRSRLVLLPPSGVPYAIRSGGPAIPTP